MLKKKEASEIAILSLSPLGQHGSLRICTMLSLTQELRSCSRLLRQALRASAICAPLPGRQWGHSPQLKAAEKDCATGTVVGSRCHTWNESPQTNACALL